MNYRNYNYIDGESFTAFIQSGAAKLKQNIGEINDLNVFPIPDGDTGDNMYLTLSGGISEMNRETSPLLWKKAKALAGGMLLSARGNSGVILSQLFFGFSNGLGEKERVTLRELTQAFHAGVERAYSTVIEPVEGTILTVARETAEQMDLFLGSREREGQLPDNREGAERLPDNRETEKQIDRLDTGENEKQKELFPDTQGNSEQADIPGDTEETAERYNGLTLEEYSTELLRVMHASLSHTPELLDVLKEAGVVDSGGAGLYMIMEGVARAIRGEALERIDEGMTLESSSAGRKIDLGLFTEDSTFQFGYCTEFLLRLMRSKVDVEAFDEKVIIDYLSTIGDSIVAFKDGSIVKVHVHTMTPAKAMEFCQQFGEFLALKIENMMLQHNNHVEQLGLKQEKQESEIPTVQKARAKYATCVVTTGEGIKEVFREMGADEIMDGGHGKNPSTKDFLDCFDRLNADNIFVFPNNANIFLAAQQAAGMCEGSRVFVIPSRSIGQAYTAMAMLDVSFDTPEEVEQNFITNMEYAATGMVCRASREYHAGELDITEEDYVGLTDRELLSVAQDKVSALRDLCLKMGIADRDIVTVIYGEDVTEEEKAKVQELMGNEWAEKEFYEIEGCQEIFDFIVILE